MPAPFSWRRTPIIPCIETGCGRRSSCPETSDFCVCDDGYEPDASSDQQKYNFFCVPPVALPSGQRLAWTIGILPCIFGFIGIVLYLAVYFSKSEHMRSARHVSTLSIVIPDLLYCVFTSFGSIYSSLALTLFMDSLCEAIAYLNYVIAISSVSGPFILAYFCSRLTGLASMTKRLKQKVYGALLLQILVISAFGIHAYVRKSLGSYRDLACYIKDWDDIVVSRTIIILVLLSYLTCFILIGLNREIMNADPMSSRAFLMIFNCVISWLPWTAVVILHSFGNPPPLILEYISSFCCSLRPGLNVLIL